MKYRKIIWISCIAIAMVLVALAIPASPAKAVPNITVKPDLGRIGDKVTVTGLDFNKSTEAAERYAAIYFSSQQATTMQDIGVHVTTYKKVKDVLLDEFGSFKTTINIPYALDEGKVKAEVTSGLHYIYVCHYLGTMIQPRIRAIAEFTVLTGEITLSPQKGTVGSSVEISGTSFPNLAELGFLYDESLVPIESGQTKTGTSGNFLTVIRIPESTAGVHTISAHSSITSASATFTVKPELTVLPSTGEVDSILVVSGTGFGKNSQVVISFQNIQLVTITTSALGSFDAQVVVPELPEGTYTVKASGEANMAMARFTLTVPPPPKPVPTPVPPSPPTTSISSVNGNVGQGIVVTGSGFKADGIIAVKYDDKLIAFGLTAANGLFASGFTIPASKAGAHVITITDGNNIKEIKFTVESVPPTVPRLLSPDKEARIEAPMTFYWSPATDDSQPITYTLQIATNSDFLPTSIIVNKETLNKTEYTITRQDQLDVVKMDTPYYWRIRAVDGASNEGSWTNAREFYVGETFPGWALYTIVALGIILFFGLGYFTRMKVGSFRQN